MGPISTLKTDTSNNYNEIKLQYSTIKHHSHNKYFCSKMKNLLDISKGKATQDQPNLRNYYHEEDSKYRHKYLQKSICKSKTLYDNKLPACL
jgi:hypothetical protein